MQNKLLIFDLDGTIADTLYTIKDAVNLCLEHFGLPTRNYEEIKAAVGNGSRVLLYDSLPEKIRKDDKLFEEYFEYFSECYRQTHDNVNGCYEGLFEVLKALYSDGAVMALLSNKPDSLVGGIVKKLGLCDMFVSAHGQTALPKKPDPAVPLMLCKEYGKDVKNTYFIGDSEVDIQTAKNAGMHSVAVSWGFRTRDALVKCHPDVIVDTPKQLYEFLKKN